MEKEIFEYKRKSYIEIGEIYFWTATLNKWQCLLKDDSYKNIIIDSLDYLYKNGKRDVFAFVLMSNHIHLLLRVNEKNGKETSQGSFLKFTAHAFKKMLGQDNPALLSNFKIKAMNKEYEFWQRDSLAILIYTKEVAWQKLDYIHNNPLAEHWNLVDDPCGYKYSSAITNGKKNPFPF